VIRTNLSTRPFYNERAVHLWLLAIALAVAAATLFNVSRVIRYSRSDTQLATQASHDETQAADLRKEAVRLRASVDPRQVEFASGEARLANELIDRRTFSWTELFNRLETTLPDDVRITAVRPKLDRVKGFVVVINVVARSVDDVNLFMENLDKAGAFSGLLSRTDRLNEQGLLESAIETTYLPAESRSPVAKPTVAKPAARGRAARP
jgi:Tfp pilus assembly protein PilN